MSNYTSFLDPFRTSSAEGKDSGHIDWIGSPRTLYTRNSNRRLVSLPASHYLGIKKQQYSERFPVALYRSSYCETHSIIPSHSLDHISNFDSLHAFLMPPECFAFQKAKHDWMRPLHLSVLTSWQFEPASFRDWIIVEEQMEEKCCIPTSEGFTKVLLLCALGYLRPLGGLRRGTVFSAAQCICPIG